jgi:hypothetical protein
VLVERVEGFATDEEWRRGYGEIRHFEEQVIAHGSLLVKFWIHITKDEQLKRFRDRTRTEFKRWKIGPDDWRNRGRWADYTVAVNEMVARTSTEVAPWTLVEGNDKNFARIKVPEDPGRSSRTPAAQMIVKAQCPRLNAQRSGCALDLVSLPIALSIWALGIAHWALLERQPQSGSHAALVAAVFECERAPVSFRDLAAQHESDARASGLRREERHEEVAGCSAAPAPDRRSGLRACGRRDPARRHTAAGLERGVHRIANEIDQQLLELIRVRRHGDVSAGPKPTVIRVSTDTTRRISEVNSTGLRLGAGRRASRAYAVVNRLNASARER